MSKYAIFQTCYALCIRSRILSFSSFCQSFLITVCSVRITCIHDECISRKGVNDHDQCCSVHCLLTAQRIVRVYKYKERFNFETMLSFAFNQHSEGERESEKDSSVSLQQAFALSFLTLHEM